jgi:heavy metal sensor kinase
MFLDRIPVRLRLSLGHAIWMAVVFLTVGYGLYRVVEHNLYRSVDASLLTSAQSIRDARFIRGFSPPLMERFLNQFFGEKAIRPYAQLVDLSGKISAKTDVRVSLPVTPKALARAERGYETFETFPPRFDSEAPLRQVTLPVIKFGRFTGELIQVGASLDSTFHTLREIAWVLWISLPIAILASVLFGYLLTKRSLNPVTELSAAVQRLGSDDLSVRLPLPPAKDELRQLAETFNEMLARLEDAFMRLRRFTGDVSHELRTPLAVLRGEAELALRKERPAEDYKASLQTIKHEAYAMTTIIEDLLLLARAESKAVAMTWMELSTVDFVAELVNVVQPVYDDKKISLRVINRARNRFKANTGYLTLALKNILINAAKHSGQGSIVELDVANDGYDTTFTITDSGEGIPAESLPYIFDPFYRADTARNRAAGGTGIGLSLAMALVKLHGGTINVRSKPGEGASFTVRIPIPKEDQPTPEEPKAKDRQLLALPKSFRHA